MPYSELTAYFASEKQGGILLIALAAASLAFAAWLLMTKNVFSAMAWPVLVLGVLELVIGVAIAGRTAAQVAELEAGLERSRNVTVTAEVARMGRVNGTFDLVKKLEIAFIVVGLVFAVARPAPATLGAVGLGIVLQCAALLVFDTFAHHRAERYVQWLMAVPPT